MIIFIPLKKRFAMNSNSRPIQNSGMHVDYDFEDLSWQVPSRLQRRVDSGGPRRVQNEPGSLTVGIERGLQAAWQRGIEEESRGRYLRSEIETHGEEESEAAGEAQKQSGFGRHSAGRPEKYRVRPRADE